MEDETVVELEAETLSEDLRTNAYSVEIRKGDDLKSRAKITRGCVSASYCDVCQHLTAMCVSSTLGDVSQRHSGSCVSITLRNVCQRYFPPRLSAALSAHFAV